MNDRVPPEAEDAIVSVRGYIYSKTKGFELEDIGPSQYSLIFDTETFTDEAQQLRVGSYQLRESGTLVEAGYFYDPESLGDDERATLRARAREKGFEVLTWAEFLEYFFRLGLRPRRSGRGPQSLI